MGWVAEEWRGVRQTLKVLASHGAEVTCPTTPAIDDVPDQVNVDIGSVNIAKKKKKKKKKFCSHRK
jgi:hypothetical protein